MKSYITVLLFLFSFVFSQTPNIFFQGSWDELRQKAKEDTIPFFVDFYAVWCAPCKIMDKTFSTDTIKNYLGGKYIAYRINVDTKFGKKLARKYRAMGLPMIAFFDNRGKLMGRYIGYLYAGEFILIAEKYRKKFYKRLERQRKRARRKRK